MCGTLAQSYCNQGHISSLLTYLSTFKPQNKEHLDSKQPENSELFMVPKNNTIIELFLLTNSFIAIGGNL